MRVPRGQQFGLRSRASGRLHGTPCLSRISETPKDFDHTIVSTFGRTAAPPVRPLFLHLRLSLLPPSSPPSSQNTPLRDTFPHPSVPGTLRAGLPTPSTRHRSESLSSSSTNLSRRRDTTQPLAQSTHYSRALTYAEPTFSFSTRSRHPRNSATPRFPQRPRGRPDRPKHQTYVIPIHDYPP